MSEDLQEQSCWLLLAFESGLSTRIINDILVVWCKQLGRTLQEFFATSKEEWIATCHLKTEIIQKLEQAKEKLVGQPSTVINYPLYSAMQAICKSLNAKLLALLAHVMPGNQASHLLER